MSGELEARLRARARALGFDQIGVADVRQDWPVEHPAAARLTEWLARQHHAGMDWMAHTAQRRAHPRALWGEAQSVVMLGLNYGPNHDPLALLSQKERAIVSAYAQRRDYHDVVKGRLKTLAQWLAKETAADVKVFVDTAPLLEKPLAQQAGLGWQGKHTNLVSRDFGAWLLLGAILTAAALKPDAPHADHCGACQACLDICPTNAFPKPYQLDARRCLAYLTIEHAGPIPHEFRAAMGNRVFGCDDCLAVCPWNKFAQHASDAKLAANSALQGRDLAELAALGDAEFRTLFAGTPVKRTGRDRFVRNVAIAIGNSGQARFVPICLRLLEDQSPLVRGAAIWALRQLLDREAFARLKEQRAGSDTCADVEREWAGS